MNDLQYYTKAYSLAAVDNAVDFNTPIGSDHEFFTDFSGVRGDLIDKDIYRDLNIDLETFTFNEKLHQKNKTLMFLSGMRGSGKTSELAKISKKF